MMNENAEFYVEMWSMMKGYVDKLHMETAAEHFVNLVMDYEDDSDLLRQLLGTDLALDNAIELCLETSIDEED